MFDRVTAGPGHWFTKAPAETDETRRWDPRPATQDELDAYFDRGGVVTLGPPPQAPRRNRRARIIRLQRAWARDFNPLACIPDAVRVVEAQLELIKPTARRNVLKWSRIKAAVRAIGIEGRTQQEFASNEKLDEGQVSRLMNDAYKRYPKLRHALKLLNLLNQQVNRGELSNTLVSCLRGKELLVGKRAEDQQQEPYAEYPAAVKLAELDHEIFPPITSNYPAALVIKDKEDATVGTRRVLWEMRLDDKGYEVGVNDYKARLWNQDDHDRWHDTIDTWHRLRRFAGLSTTEGLDLPRVLPIAGLFFGAEALRQATTEALPRHIGETELPTSATPYCLNAARTAPVFVGAPSRDEGYLGPVGREFRRPRTAPLPKPYRLDGTACAAPSGIATSAERLSPTGCIAPECGASFEARLASILKGSLARSKESKRWAVDGFF